MQVRNYMENVVDNLLPGILATYNGICKCQRCVSDIKAMTLNDLPPKYIACEMGEVYTKVNELSVQFEASVVTAVVKAIGIVSKFPRHWEKYKVGQLVSWKVGKEKIKEKDKNGSGWQ